MPPHTPQVEGARAPPGLEPLTGEQRAGIIQQSRLHSFALQTRCSVTVGA